jgi:hypothetical protein
LGKQIASLSTEQQQNVIDCSIPDDCEDDGDSKPQHNIPSCLKLPADMEARRVVRSDYSLSQYKLPTAACKVILAVFELPIA